MPMTSSAVYVGIGVDVGAGAWGIGILVGVGTGVGVDVAVGTAVNTALTLASTVASASDSLIPPQPTNSISAVVRRSSRMTLSFMLPYYPKRLLNGSDEVTALGGTPPF